MLSQWVSVMLALLTAGSLYVGQGAQGNWVTPDPVPSPELLSGSYSLIVEGFAWGPGVSKAVLELDRELTQVSGDWFSVTEEKETRPTAASAAIHRTPRNVTGAYLSDSEGAAVEGASRCITLTMDCSPEIGSPLCLHSDSSHYEWANPYHLVIELRPGIALTLGRETYTGIAIRREPTRRLVPQTDVFSYGAFAWGEETISYAHYIPQDAREPLPLVLWLHGLGEGGTDPSMALLDSGAVNLAGETIQAQLGGACVLVPQCPTMWMDDGSGHNTLDGSSRYSAALLALLRSYLSDHREVDPNRVYVGGSSNGGFMTIALLLQAPAAFAAAFPVCETFQDKWLSDEDISLLSKLPIWFVHSELDQICNPEQTSFATVHRLTQAGAEQVRLTRLGQILNEKMSREGQQVYFNAHFSWVPVLAGECRDTESGEPLFTWLTRHSLGAEAAE